MSVEIACSKRVDHRIYRRLLGLVVIMMMVAGCDKVVKAKPTAVSVKNVGPEAVVVDAPEEKENRELGAKGSKLLYAREFDELERIAGELRDSKAQWENGYWKLGSFYAGFCDLPDEALDARWTNLLGTFDCG